MPSLSFKSLNIVFLLIAGNFLPKRTSSLTIAKMEIRARRVRDTEPPMVVLNFLKLNSGITRCLCKSVTLIFRTCRNTLGISWFLQSTFSKVFG